MESKKVFAKAQDWKIMAKNIYIIECDVKAKFQQIQKVTTIGSY
jgi:hypothetical protein